VIVLLTIYYSCTAQTIILDTEAGWGVGHGPESSRVLLGAPRRHLLVAEVRRDQKQTRHHKTDGQAEHLHPGDRLHFALDAALVAAFHPA
jgi:hypothetical protein